MDCKACKARFRADKLIEDFTKGRETGDGWSNEEGRKVHCRARHRMSGMRQEGLHRHPPVNLMFKTHAGVNDDSAAEIYLRPETAQGIFVNFANAMRTTRKKLPAVSARSASPSATRLRPATSYSACASSADGTGVLLQARRGSGVKTGSVLARILPRPAAEPGHEERNLRLRDRARRGQAGVLFQGDRL